MLLEGGLVGGGAVAFVLGETVFGPLFVMLPHEAHTYQARESVGHTLAEMVAWYDKHVKGEGESSEVGEN